MAESGLKAKAVPEKKKGGGEDNVIGGVLN